MDLNCSQRPGGPLMYRGRCWSVQLPLLISPNNIEPKLALALSLSEDLALSTSPSLTIELVLDLIVSLTPVCP